PANIAEGNGRDSIKEYLRHLSIAVGSLCEVETFLQLAVRLQYNSSTQIDPVFEMLNEEGRMLRGLQKSLRAKLSQPF
ncbi:MAG: four helix bundle protein, partial [Planctomycetota bacterium]